MKPGDKVRIVQPRADHSVRFFARVSWTEEREGGTYFGYVPIDPPRGEWGLPASRCGSFGAQWDRHDTSLRPYAAKVEVIPS